MIYRLRKWSDARFTLQTSEKRIAQSAEGILQQVAEINYKTQSHKGQLTWSVKIVKGIHRYVCDALLSIRDQGLVINTSKLPVSSETNRTMLPSGENVGIASLE